MKSQNIEVKEQFSTVNERDNKIYKDMGCP